VKKQLKYFGHSVHRKTIFRNATTRQSVNSREEEKKKTWKFNFFVTQKQWFSTGVP